MPKRIRRDQKRVQVDLAPGEIQLAGFFIHLATQIEEGCDPVIVLIDAVETCAKMLRIARKGAEE